MATISFLWTLIVCFRQVYCKPKQRRKTNTKKTQNIELSLRQHTHTRIHAYTHTNMQTHTHVYTTVADFECLWVLVGAGLSSCPQAIKHGDATSSLLDLAHLDLDERRKCGSWENQVEWMQNGRFSRFLEF